VCDSDAVTIFHDMFVALTCVIRSYYMKIIGDRQLLVANGGGRPNTVFVASVTEFDNLIIIIDLTSFFSASAGRTFPKNVILPDFDPAHDIS
jgi:hypothetical protein